MMKRLWWAAIVLCCLAVHSSATVTSPNDLDTNYFQDGQVGTISAARFRALNNSISGMFISQQAGTSYTFSLADRGTMVESTSSSATTFTVPTNATAAFDIGAVISFREYGTGALTIAGASGVTIRTPTSLIVRTQYGSGFIQKRATNEWVLSGDMQ